MKTRALGFLLMVAAAGVYAVGCGSSSPKTGTGGAGMDAGTGGKGTGGAGMDAGTGGKGTGGMGMGGKMDSGTDMATDTPTDGGAPTFTEVFAIISDKSTATSPGCTTCHDGVNTDGGAGTGLPHGMDFTTKTAAYAALVGVNSIRCPGGADAGGDASTAALKRVLAGNAAQSVLWQKLNQGVNGNSMPACDNVAMPLNVPKPTDGGATDGGDAGFTLTTYMVTAGQLATVMGWINAGALNN
jgi:hypothetical protein